MNIGRRLFCVLVATAFCSTPVAARPSEANGSGPSKTVTLTQPRASPHDVVHLLREGNRVTIIYGRPFTRDPSTGQPRKVWGELVPYGKVWRLGADEATLLITQQPIDMGGTVVPAGVYSLWMQPEADGSAQLIINKEIGQWGLDYHAKFDFARAALTRSPLHPPLHQLTLALEPAKPAGGILRIMWEDQQFTVPYKVIGSKAPEKP